MTVALEPARSDAPRALGVLPLCAGIPAGIVAVLVGPAAGLVILLGALAVAATVVAPGIVFAAYLLIPFYKGAVQAYSPLDVTAVLAVLNAAQVVAVVRAPAWPGISRAGLVLMAALSLLVLGGTLYASDQEFAWARAVAWWCLVVLPIVPAALRVGSNPTHVRQFLWTFFIVGAVTVVVGLSIQTGAERLVLPGLNTINFALAVLLVPLLGVVFVVPQRHAPLTVATLALIPGAFVVELASGSRGPLLVIAVLGLIGIVVHVARRRSVDWRSMRRIGAAALLTGAIVAAGMTDIPAQSLQRFALFEEFVVSGLQGDLNTSVGDTSAGQRVALFEAAVEMFVERPLLGAGTGGFAALSPRYLSVTASTEYPHNAVLQVAVEFGLVGLVLCCGLAALALGRRLSPDGVAGAVRALFLFFLLEAMVSGDIFSDRTTWGLLLLIVLSRVPDAATDAGSSRAAAPGSTLAAAPVVRPRDVRCA